MWKLLFCLLWIPGLLFAQGPNKFTSTIRPSPTINAGSDLILSVSQPTVQPLATTDSPSNIVGWVGPNGFTSSILKPWLETPGNYILTATNSYGCSASDDLLVRMANPLDTFWTVTQLPSLCLQADSLLLDDFVSQPGKGTFSGTGVIGRVFYPIAAGSTTVEWIVDQKISSITASVFANPDVSVYEDSLIRCPGRIGTLGAIGTADIYNWSLLSDPDVVLATTPFYDVTVNSRRAYLLKAGKVYGDKTCYIRDTTEVMPITAEFSVRQDTFSLPFGTAYPEKVYFKATFVASGYAWNFGDIYVSGGGTSTEKDPEYSYSRFGEYRVILSVLGCGDVLKDTAIVTVNHIVTTNVDDTEQQLVQLYPNPAVDKVTLNFGQKIITSIHVVDLTGRYIQTIRVNNSYYEMDVSSYRPGTYILKIIDQQGGSAIAKLVKQ